MIQLTDKHWAVEVPEGAKCIRTYTGFVFNNYADMVAFDFDKSNWQFLFTTKEATEEDAQLIVEPSVAGFWENYHNFLDDTRFEGFDTGAASLKSLLASKGCDPDKNWAIIKNDSDAE